MNLHTFYFLSSSGKVMAVTITEEMSEACEHFKIIFPSLTIQQIEEFVLSDTETMEFYNWKTEMNLAMSQTELA